MESGAVLSGLFALENVSGTAIGDTVLSGGIQRISSGGAAIGTTLEVGGSAIALSPA